VRQKIQASIWCLLTGAAGSGGRVEPAMREEKSKKNRRYYCRVVGFRELETEGSKPGREADDGKKGGSRKGKKNGGCA